MEIKLSADLEIYKSNEQGLSGPDLKKLNDSNISDSVRGSLPPYLGEKIYLLNVQFGTYKTTPYIECFLFCDELNEEEIEIIKTNLANYLNSTVKKIGNTQYSFQISVDDISYRLKDTNSTFEMIPSDIGPIMWNDVFDTVDRFYSDSKGIKNAWDLPKEKLLSITKSDTIKSVIKGIIYHINKEKDNG